MSNLNHLFKDKNPLKYVGSLKYVACLDEKTSDIVIKKIKDEDFYKKKVINE
jgi:hypothetical protein